MKKTYTILLLKLLVLMSGNCDSLQKQIFIIDTLSRLSFCDILKDEADILAVSCRPGATSGQAKIMGGVTRNDQGELVPVGRLRLHAREFGVFVPFLLLSGNRELAESTFEWAIDPDGGLRSKRWNPFGFKFFQEGGCGIVKFNGLESKEQQVELIAVLPCEWKPYLKETVEIVSDNSELFCSNGFLAEGEEHLRKVANERENPFLSYLAIKKLVKSGSIDENQVVVELNKSKGLRLSLITYLLLHEMDAASVLIDKYLKQKDSDVEAIAIAAYTRFALDSKNIAFNRFNRNQKSVSGKAAFNHPTYQSNQEYLDQQGSYRVLLRIESLPNLNQEVKEILKRAYF